MSSEVLTKRGNDEMAGSEAKAAGGKAMGGARERVFAAATDLFYRKGIHAVGVEEIVRQADVAKISLYRSFASKDDLVVAYLEERGATFLAAWDEAFDRYQGAPREQLRAIMAYVTERTEAEGYRGCHFINFAAEFPDAEHPGRKLAVAIKQAIRDRFLRLAEALGAPDPQQLADAWFLLLEGAYALSQTLGREPGVATRSLVWAAEQLAEAALAQTK
jgi:AcrR family transcriptional regulator